MFRSKLSSNPPFPSTASVRAAPSRSAPALPNALTAPSRRPNALAAPSRSVPQSPAAALMSSMSAKSKHALSGPPSELLPKLKETKKTTLDPKCDPKPLEPLMHGAKGFAYVRRADGKIGPDISDVRPHVEDSHTLLKRNGRVFKPLQAGSGGKTELALYRMRPCMSMKSFIPRFHGFHKRLEGVKSSFSFLELEDLLFGMEKPTFMDVKMGTTKFYAVAASHGEGAHYTDSKCARQHAVMQRTTGGKLGWLISGVRSSALKWGTKDGKKASAEQAIEVLYGYLGLGASSVDCAADHERILTRVISCVEQLRCILHCFRNECRYAFYNSSLFFVYDEAPDASRHVVGKAVRICMIDFARSFLLKPQEQDISGYTTGLVSLIQVLLELHTALLLNRPLPDRARLAARASIRAKSGNNSSTSGL